MNVNKSDREPAVTPELVDYCRTDRQRELLHAHLEHGSVTRAAAALGISVGTLHATIQRVRRYMAKSVNDTKSLAGARQRVKQLEKIIERQQETIERMRAASVRMPTGKKTKASKGAYCRFAIPDTHGCCADKAAVSAMLGDLETVVPREIVMLGDHLDCGGFLAQHHTLGYVADTEYTFEDDAAATNQLLDAIQKASPNATIDYLEGNHERRLETWCVTQSLKNRQDAGYLRSMFSTGAVLSLEKRGIRLFEQGKYYDDCPVPSMIKRGHCYFVHGMSTAKAAARKHLDRVGASIVYGHTHRTQVEFGRTVKAGVIGAWCPGCLCELQPRWMHQNLTDWTHGYGLQLVNPDGSFLHINVPIIDGKSYLSPLIKAIS